MKKFIPLLIIAQLFNCITVSANTLYGDANNNGVLEAADSAMILQKVLNNGYELACGYEYADVNSDGSLTAADSALVLQKVLNNNYKFPAEETEKIQSISVDTLEYGTYTEDIIVGDITISASAVAPVYVENIEIPMEWVLATDPKVYELKTIRLSKDNSIIVNTSNEFCSEISVQYIRYQGMASEYIPANNLFDSLNNAEIYCDTENSGRAYDLYLYSDPSYIYSNLVADNQYIFGNDSSLYLNKIILK